MPLTRYQIRNEFNLADPDLYISADKDDPEALLEGVSMAGFVGLLRQLGDLSEFAAEIFHDLHEEVMATAARGQGLMARIQQLDADVPLIERNLLSRTDHTTFYYNTGFDWHPRMCTDQNLITQGDMPQFIRDSYEECRGPPQLFLLDKFDVGGADACLKRYTDPSSFKAEPTTSDAAKLEIQRDWRTRKVKKKSSHWRNGYTTEVLTTSHAKLHQLLLEERIVTDSKHSAHHVKLKGRFLDGSRSRKSYMEKFLQSMLPVPSPETVAGQPLLRVTYDHAVNSEREIPDIQSVSVPVESFSPLGQEMKLRPSSMYSYDFSKSRRNKGSTVRLEDSNINRTASHLQNPVAEKELGIDSDNGNGFAFPYYDAIGDETENYMDALANMESEPDTDTEYIPKKELHYFSKHADVYDSKEQVMDSQSVDNSIISDDGSTSFIKGTSTSSSHGALPNDELGEKEVSVAEYNETQKSFPNRYSNTNGETVGSATVPYNYKAGDVSYKKGYNLLLQSSESGLSSRLLTSTGAYYKTAPSKAAYDSDWPQLVKSGINGVTLETSDGPGRVDNLSVIKASSKMHKSKVPSESLTHRPEYSRHVNPKLICMIDNKGLQNGHVDESSTENLADKEEVSPQSGTDTQLLDFKQSYQLRDHSHLIPLDSDISDCRHAIVSNDDIAIYATGEILDGYNHVMNTTELDRENSDSALPEVYAYDNGGLYTRKSELAGSELFSETGNKKDQVSSEELLSQRVHEDDVALESCSGSNYDTGKGLSVSTGIYSLSGNNNNGEAVIYQPDFITGQFGNDDPEEVNLEGTPPLPPHPPVQWMVGKPQHSFLDAEGESAESVITSYGSFSPYAFGTKTNFDITHLDGDTKQPFISTEPDESSQDSSRHYLHVLLLPTDSTPQVTDAIEEENQHNLLETDKFLTDSFTIQPDTCLKIGQSDILPFDKETPVLSSESFLQTSSTNTNALTIEDAQSCYTPQLEEMTSHAKEFVQPKPVEHTILSAGESILSSATWDSPQPTLGDKIVSEYNVSGLPVRSSNQSVAETNDYSATKHEPRSVEKNIINSHAGLCLLIKDDEHRKKEMVSSERVASWSLALLNYEDEKLAEKPSIKPPRPRNPLIESVGALDRSKLKKVTPQKWHKTPPIDERGSLLEQIRAKSFNLKPAPGPVAKPIIQAPTMNLKVAAILEKANKIRRATAGSDEDDEDAWSD